MLTTVTFFGVTCNESNADALAEFHKSLIDNMDGPMLLGRHTMFGTYRAYRFKVADGVWAIHCHCHTSVGWQA